MSEHFIKPLTHKHPGSSKSVNFFFLKNLHSLTMFIDGGACGVMVIIVGNGHSDTSSNPRRG